MAATAALPRSCSDHLRMPIRRTRRRRSLLQIGPTSRTRDSVWFLLPCRDFELPPKFKQAYSLPTWYFKASPLPAAYARDASVRPKKMFQADVVQARFCFFTAAASGRDELIIDRHGRFPLRVFL